MNAFLIALAAVGTVQPSLSISGLRPDICTSAVPKSATCRFHHPERTCALHLVWHHKASPFILQVSAIKQRVSSLFRWRMISVPHGHLFLHVVLTFFVASVSEMFTRNIFLLVRHGRTHGASTLTTLHTRVPAPYLHWITRSTVGEEQRPCITHNQNSFSSG